ncbi:411_t:CDS:10 [Funneliformis caledonium]|uniref:Nonsense-mediated mRNA decay factor SMG8 n=1 Tax=Funneliformis caledonium TaxID=1117310 RepID=A0A9N9G6Z9_9GLOM|nr:411_t:CDS:10 [Funneliformis caledonium]
MEEKLSSTVSTEDDVVIESISSSNSPKEPPVLEESQSFVTLKNKIEDTLKDFKLQEAAPISVVSFIGFSQSETTSKLHLIANAIVEKNVFGQIPNEKINYNRPKGAILLISNGNNCGLWMYCDASKNIVYLLIDSVNESETMLQLWENSRLTIETEQDFQNWIWKHEHVYLRMLVFMFMLSHVVMFTQPISKLDGNMVSLLKTIHSVKRHILPHATNFLNLCWQSFEIPSPYGSYSNGVYGGRGWTAQGGVTAPGRCVPFLLFLFQEVQLSVSSTDGHKSDSIHDKASSGSIKRIKESLQARIRFLFRACHLMQTGDIHAPFDGRQLFTLPPPSNQFFVHLITRGSTGNLLSSDSITPLMSKAKISQESKIENVIDDLLKKRKLESRGAEHFEIKLLREFAHNWVKWTVNGYSRNFVKRGMPSSELPNVNQWMSGCIALQELLFGQLGKEILDRKERKSFSAVDDILQRRLKDCLQVDNRFSAGHCTQALRKAIDSYMLESPAYYNKQYHEMKLDHAIRFFMSTTRGPCVQGYVQKLRNECQTIWENGRQKSEKEVYRSHDYVPGTMKQKIMPR